MRIKQKLILGFVIASLLISLLGILGLYANNQVVNSYEIGEEHFGSIVEASNEVSSYAKRAESHTFLYLTLQNETDRRKLSQRIASLREQIEIMDGKVKNPEAIRIINETKSRINELESITESLVKIYDNETETNERFDFKKNEELIRKLDDVSAHIRMNGLELGKIEIELQKEHNAIAKQKASSFYNFIFIISGIAVLDVLIIGLVIDRSISDPLNKLMDAAIKIRKGNLNTKIDITSKDEISDLSDEFNRMAQDLQKSNDEIISSKEYTDKIVSSMDNSLIIVSSDNIIRAINNATCLLLDYREEELIDQPISKVLVDAEKLLGNSLKNNNDINNIIHNAETAFISKGQKEIPIIFSASIIQSKYRNVQDIVCVAQDITERKLAMEKLQKSQMRLEEAQRIAHIGSWESNIQTNKSYATEEACRLLDATPDEVATFEGFLSRVHPEDRELVVKSIEEIMQGKGTTFNYEYRTILKDGSIRVIYAQGEVSFDSAGKPVKISGTAMDITERKHKDEQIKASLKEKEVLLREIHHRAKNNMQIISSLLTHQMENITDEKITGIFTDSQNRIISMSLVHEKLYQSRDLMNVNFEDYINDLGANLFQSYDIQPGNIKLNINVENISLDIDLAIPTGLIINELITNSLKYAFPNGMKGEITITFRSTGENMLELVVSDNGIGFPKDIDFRKTRSLGLHLVTILTENQLHGKIDMISNKGTEFRITFKGAKS